VPKEILLSTLEIWRIEARDKWLCLGRTSDGKVGKWALADEDGYLIHPWQALTISALFSFIRMETRQRKFLKSGTFSYQLIERQGSWCLECWAIGKNRLLYSSLWSLTGICLYEWAAFLPLKENQSAIEKNWEIYRICQSRNGLWS
jgi:hypothetical protein